MTVRAHVSLNLTSSLSVFFPDVFNTECHPFKAQDAKDIYGTA